MKRFFLFALVATALAACSTDTTQDLAPEIPTAPDELQVSFDEEDTRIQLGDACRPVWTKGDLVSVFYRSNANDKWQFQGNTGDTEGSLKRIEQGTATQPTTQIVAVYPYSENYWFNWNTFNVQASLPAEQAYCKDSYGIGSSVMVSSSEYNQLSFKNVCGWLKLQFTGMGYVSKITFKGNNGEQVAGEIYINTEDASCTLASQMGVSGDGTGGNLVFDDTILTSVTLNCGNGVELGTEPTAFYIALPPQTFEKGITVEITDSSDFTMTQSTENSVTVERNHILPMAALEFVNPNTPSTTPASNEIWYTATAKVEPYWDGAFDANIVSNEWDSETGKGIIIFDGDVSTIGNDAFLNCTSLTSVTIPDSVTTIGGHAFQYCSALTSVTIPDSVTTIGEHAFYNCDALTSVTIPDSVTTIGNSAFEGCSSLTSVTIPDSVTTIGECAFSWCTSLISVTIPNSVTTIEYGAFYNCPSLTSVNIPDCVTTIEEDVFGMCTSLISVTIPDKVVTIGDHAFIGCSSLTSVTIPDSVTMIGKEAFAGCSGLYRTMIGNGVTYVGDYAFNDCSGKLFVNKNVESNWFQYAGFTEVIIGDGVTSIGDYAFAYSDVSKVNLPEGLTSIGANAFNKCVSLTSINFPNSITSIGDFAFSESSITFMWLTTPPNMKKIGNGVFANTNIANLTIANGVTSIGYSAFKGCDLNTVKIPSSVTSIGDTAFCDCVNLNQVTCQMTTPPTLGYNAFDISVKTDPYSFTYDINPCTIYVPSGCAYTYKKAKNWSRHASYIKEQ